LFCRTKTVGTGVALLSKTKYPMTALGTPGLLGSLRDFVCETLNAHLKFATGQVVVGPLANAPLLEITTAQIVATTNEIVLIRKKTPPSELRAIRHVPASHVNQ
jgi:hypothetical protein